MNETVVNFEVHQKKHYPYRDGCYWDLIDRSVWDLVDMYSHYKNGHLWFNQLISHNPAWYVEAMKILDAKLKEPKLDL